MKLGRMSPSTWLFFKIALAIWGSLQFHKNLRIDLPISYQKGFEIERDSVEPVISLGNIDFLTVSSFPVCEHGMSFHLFRALISFSSVLVFSIQCFISLVRFIAEYLILLDATVNEIAFLISFGICLLLVHKNLTNLLWMV